MFGKLNIYFSKHWKNTDPLFKPEPEILFGAGAAPFAAGLVGSYESIFNYDNGSASSGEFEATMDISAVPVRDYLLAKAFPARTGALGSRAISAQVSTEWQKATFDMSTQLRNPYASILPGDDDYWIHSAIRDFPYVHMCNFFRKLVGKELITINP